MNDQTKTNNIVPLLQGLAKAPIIDVAMCLSAGEIDMLFDLVLRGAMAASGFGDPAFTERELADAERLARILSIDPATGEHQAGPSEAEIAAQAKREQIDRFLDDLSHQGE